MAASGVTVQDSVVTEFVNIKTRHLHQYIQMKLSKDCKEIEIDKTAPLNSCTFDEFVAQLPKDDCRYAVFDFHFNAGNAGQREQLILVVWCPETANIRMKMIYTASKDALKKKLVGINHEIQANDLSDLCVKDVTDKVLLKMVK